MSLSKLPSNVALAGLLFDLDGTLIDSSGDLTGTVNRLLGKLGLQQLDPVRVLSFVGEGVRVLVTRSLTAATGNAPTDTEVSSAVNQFEELYAQHMLDETRLYPNVVEMLAELKGFPKAVVTNKARGFSVAILEALGIAGEFEEVVGGDCPDGRKPSAAPLLYALRHLGVEPSRAMMVGDTKIDIISGQAAGTWTCGYSAGFRGRRDLEDAGADVIIDDMLELAALVSEKRKL